MDGRPIYWVSGSLITCSLTRSLTRSPTHSPTLFLHIPPPTHTLQERTGYAQSRFDEVAQHFTLDELLQYHVM